MVYAPHRRLTLSGTLGAASEEAFSFGIALDENLFTAGDDQVVFDDIVAESQAFFSSPLLYVSPFARLRMVKLAKIGADGKYTADPLFVDTLNRAGGGSTSGTHPFQCSLAVSLVTARRGSSGRGRFYLPMPTLSVADSGLIPFLQAQEVATTVAGWIDAVADRPGIDSPEPTVVVASSKGFLSPVTAVRVGRVIDTIRSRRRALSEAYGPEIAVSN